MSASDEAVERWINQPEWASDAVLIKVDVVLGWPDILLIIFRRGRFGILVKTWTESAPGRVETVERIILQRITWPWERHKLVPYSVVAPPSDMT